ncbi:MAG: class I SAM-dependent methyltransferase [Anaerolineales bacterium]|nr:class I SAM-dependent methyltransferase [Anaerolineales bacterium]
MMWTNRISLANHIDSWLDHQSEQMVLVWEKSIERFYPQYLEIWTNPELHLKTLSEVWNLPKAADELDWETYLTGDQLKIIDIGAGTGWLSIMLSKYQNVEQIYTLDASPTNLQMMLPALIKPLGGNPTKIKPVLGLFTPLLVPDNFFNIAVASSAVHHAPDLTELLSEVYRVIKPGGFFLILNEQPFSPLRYALVVLYRCVKILRTIALQQWQPVAKPISETGLMLDPFLGDRAYGYWQWQKAIQSAGFSFEMIKTSYHPRQNEDTRFSIKLTHFVAQKPLC